MTQIAQTDRRTITVDSAQYEESVLCTYKFQFSINAGPGDVMNVEFTQATKSGLAFAVGTSFITAAYAQKIEQPEGQKIGVPYPNSLFIIFFNTGSRGEFIITYSYEDNDPSDAEDLFNMSFTLENTVVKE